MARMSDRRRQFMDQRYVFFVTFSVDKRRRLLDLDHPKRIVLGVLNHQLEAFRARCVGFVLMPDHVHALLWLPEPAEFPRLLHGWKRMSSFTIRRWYDQHAPHYFAGFGPGDRFWQPKSYTFHVYTERKLRQKLSYMHLNPVRAGLVQKAEDWLWSSARWYIHRQTVGVPITWID
jgi:putative transposase